MKRSVKPSRLNGSVAAPPSKSVMLRAVAAATLAPNGARILNRAHCDDALAALDIAASLGCRIESTEKEVFIKRSGSPPEKNLFCGESGLCMRMFAPVAAVQGGEFILTGKPSLLKRPLGAIENTLESLGVRCRTADGYAPLKIEGCLAGGTAMVDASLTSQFLTGLLIALPMVENNSVLNVRNMKSKPYIDLTIGMLEKFGIIIERDGYQKFMIPGNQQYNISEYEVEGDWSGAAFLLAAGATAGGLSITGLNSESYQPDKKILNVLESAGANIQTIGNRIEITGGTLKSFSFDASDSPDLIPPLVTLACRCTGTSRIKGVARLKHKESDREAALLEEFTRLGAKIDVEDDSFFVKGSRLKGGLVSSHGDHRIAMASAVAGLCAEESVIIEDSGCVSKSYPRFWQDMKKLGARIDE